MNQETQPNRTKHRPEEIYISEEEILEQKSSERKKDLEEVFGEENIQQESEVEERYDILYHWRGLEFEHYGINPKFYLGAIIVLAAIILYSLITNNPIVAITFILIGITGYLYVQKEPREIDFLITSEGIIAGSQMYEYDKIKSFWIFYDPPFTKTVSFHLEGSFMPYFHIPVHDQDPVVIREVLLDFIPEIKQEHTLIDAFERLIHM